MEKFDTRQFTSRFNKISFLVFIVLFLISAILIFIQNHNKKEADDKQLIEQFKTKTEVIEKYILQVTDSLNMLQNQAQGYFLNPRLEPSFLIRNLEVTEPGEYGLVKIPYAYTYEQTPTLTGLGVLSDATPESLLTEIEMSLGLSSAFKSVTDNISNAAWVYYLSVRDFIVMYPWHSVDDFKFTRKLYDEEFYKLNLLENNPEGDIRWTQVYEDHAGKGLMVTATKPIYYDNEFIGVVAIDFTLEDLSRIVSSFRSEKGNLLILNSNREFRTRRTDMLDINSDTEVIADRSYLNQSSDRSTLIEHMNDIEGGHLLSSDSSICDKKGQMDLLANGVRYLCDFMKSAPWVIIYVEDPPGFFSNTFSLIGILFLVLLACFWLILIAMRTITFKEFIRPAESLVSHIYHQGNSDIDIKNRLPEPWQPWFSTITNTFEQNRNLIEEIKLKNSELTDLNISLERYMPKFVVIVSLDDSDGSAVVGSSLASVLSDRSSDKKTVYIEYPCKDEIGKQLGFEGEEDIYQHPNGFDIWNDFELGEFPESAKSSLLASKLLNHYGNIVMHTRVSGDADKFIETYLEPLFPYTKAMVVAAPQHAMGADQTADFVRLIKKHVRHDQANIYTMGFDLPGHPESGSRCDLNIPYSEHILPFSASAFVIEPGIQGVLDTVIDRIERVHQVSVFIPTTIDVDQPIDASIYVERALVFLGQKFGGATSSQARGVWNSEDSGIVSESVHIVVSYTTEDDLNRFANEVVEFIKGLKDELRQEAMALEIDKKLILV